MKKKEKDMCKDKERTRRTKLEAATATATPMGRGMTGIRNTTGGKEERRVGRIPSPLLLLVGEKAGRKRGRSPFAGTWVGQATRSFSAEVTA